ncbi:CvpA family protein [bacterium]|nr:CvpA family protein [bacterium]
MGDLFGGPFAPFDVIVFAVLLVSAVMSLGRGLIREASSVLAFIAGGLVAYYALVLFREPLKPLIPAGWPEITSSAILVVVGFLIAYSIAALIGTRLSRLIHSSPEIGILDRIAGAAFGAARGALAVILFVLLMQQFLTPASTPRFIADSQIYPYADAAAEWLRKTMPGFVDRARETIDKPLEGVRGVPGADI